MTRTTNVNRDVRWNTSPTCARILEYLECRGEAGYREIAEKIHATPKYVDSLLRVLHAAGVIYIAAYRHNINGCPTPLYRLGKRKDARRPAAETAAERSNRRRNSLRRMYGAEVASKVLNSKKYGRPRIYHEGMQITPGAHDSQLAGKVSRR